MFVWSCLCLCGGGGVGWLVLLVVLWRSNSASEASSRSWFALHHSHSYVLFRVESRLHFVYNKISIVSVDEGTQQQQQ